MSRWRWLAVMLAVLAPAVVFVSREARWWGPLYCIERAGQAGTVPPGFTPECPTTASYRQEVRRGETRVEQYATAGWQPRALLSSFTPAGWRQLSDEPVNAQTYVAFLESGSRRIQYLAERTLTGTRITLSGRP